jgi:hypothetical protein
MTSHQNLLAQPTLLPEEPGALALAAGEAAVDVAARYPASSAAWAALASSALAVDEAVQGYAYARTGYHRGLDALRRAGWKGAGPIPWSHEPNRGFLRALDALARAASAIGETEEAQRCQKLLADSDPAAVAALA